MKKIISIFALLSMPFMTSVTYAKNKFSTSMTCTTVSTKSQNAGSIKYKCKYKYDEDGRIVNKVTFYKEDGYWKPLDAYSIYYGKGENIVTHAQWDTQYKTFTLNVKQNKYNNEDFIEVMDSIKDK